MSKKTCLCEGNKKADCKKKVVFYLQFAFSGYQITQLSQAINSHSVPTTVGKCKISIEKNKEKIEKIYLFIFIY